MGYNVDLYARQPIQLDYVIVTNNQHYFPRDRERRMHPCRIDGGWTRPIKDGTYLVEMRYRPAGPGKSNYKITGLRRISDEAAHRVIAANAELYELMKLRDEAGFDIKEDPLFGDIRKWIHGEPIVGKIDEKLKRLHKDLLNDYHQTGIPNQALKWIAAVATISIADFNPELPGDLQ